MLPNPDASVTAIAKLLGVSPGTLYNHIPDLRELRAAGRARTIYLQPHRHPARSSRLRLVTVSYRHPRFARSKLPPAISTARTTFGMLTSRGMIKCASTS